MEVVYYQLFIALSIVLVRFLKPEFLIWVCLLLSFFTVANLFYPPLIFIQLGVVWVTFSLVRKNSTEPQPESKSVRTAREVPSSVHVDSSDAVALEGKAHLRYLLRSLGEADHELVILSGWISKHVVDDRFLSTLEKRLSAGLKAYIGFGYEDGSNSHPEWSLEAAAPLLELAKKYPVNLFVARFPTHRKLLVMDQKEVVIGSSNWLSNRDYRNSERSQLIRAQELAQREASEAKALILANTITLN